VWSFGDGTSATGMVWSHTWTTSGTFNVTLTAVNATYPGGISATATVTAVDQTVHYVVDGNTSASFPFTSWATAAATIQQAVNAASSGALILVSNGLYNTGMNVSPGGTLPNRIVITKELTIKGVDGPDATIIEGAAGADGCGPGAVRGIYIESGAIEGFTITNGHTYCDGDNAVNGNGGGVYVGDRVTFTDCVIAGNQSFAYGGGAFGGTWSNCTFIGNRVIDEEDSGNGGGVHSAVLQSCILESNTAANYGGGAANVAAIDSAFRRNSAGRDGGGAQRVQAYGCLFEENWASNEGGGIDNADCYASVLRGNTTPGSGGGSADSTVFNSLIVNNHAAVRGGGIGWQRCYNCTIVGNSAGAEGGGLAWVDAYNSIVYDNTAPVHPNASEDCFYSCVTPLLVVPGNISDDPQLVGPYQLSGASPCIAAGSSVYVVGTDLAGNAWNAPPSMGCYERPAAMDGDISLSIGVPSTNIAAGYAAEIRADVDGHITALRWDLGDGTVVSNEWLISHTWTGSGQRDIVLTAWNADNPAGIAASTSVTVQAGLYYVDLTNAAPASPFTTWGSAATSIQDAVDVAVWGGTVLVADGVYDQGACSSPHLSDSNRVVITKDVSIQSVNGWSNTSIVGAADPLRADGLGSNAVRCVFVENGSLEGFTLLGGHTSAEEEIRLKEKGGGAVVIDGQLKQCHITGNRSSADGGGVYAGRLIDCVVSSNAATDGSGGGVAYAYLERCHVVKNASLSSSGGGLGHCNAESCLIEENSAKTDGGGTRYSDLWSCTVVNNTATNDVGGCYRGFVTNSIVVMNIAISGTNHNLRNCPAGYTCTYPDPGGPDNIETNDPGFVNAGAGDFRLLTNSVCVDAGNNALVSGSQDLDNLPRILHGTVDMGAYETPVQLLLVASSSAHGTIAPSGTVEVAAGSNVVFTMTPDPYYHVGDVRTNGVSAGSATTYNWTNIAVSGTFYALFAENLAASNTPEWWLASHGWTNNFDTYALGDQDGDGLLTCQEYPYLTNPKLVDTDGDGATDAHEVNVGGTSPTVDNSACFDVVESYPADFDLYTSNSISDLDMGHMMLAVSNGNVNLSLQLEQCTNLTDDIWTDVGTPKNWTHAASDGKAFYRVRGGAPGGNP